MQARALYEAKLRNLTEFKASDGWFRNWRKRCEIGASICLNGEAGEVNEMLAMDRIDAESEEITEQIATTTSTTTTTTAT